MVTRARSVYRLLPHGPLDLVRQIVLFWVAYYAYSLVRGVADDPGVAAQAFENARGIISLEQTLGFFVEPSVQTWSMGSGVLIDGASWMYINAQTTVTLSALAWIYLFRNRSFYFVRNMFMAAMVVALAGYLIYPTAPPRFFPEWGFSDSVSDFTGIAPTSDGVNAMFNPYAAVPSMHVAFALMVGWPLAKLVKNRYVSAFWWAYPLLVSYVIVATGNHFVMDAILGAGTAAISAVAARELARARPAAWRFGPQTATST
jgi:PAP2 superfamily